MKVCSVRAEKAARFKWRRWQETVVFTQIVYERIGALWRCARLSESGKCRQSSKFCSFGSMQMIVANGLGRLRGVGRIVYGHHKTASQNA